MSEEISMDQHDPDIALITRFLAHDLAPAERAAVEERLVNDEAFFNAVGPLLRAWALPVRSADLVAAYRARVLDDDKRFSETDQETDAVWGEAHPEVNQINHRSGPEPDRRPWASEPPRRTVRESPPPYGAGVPVAHDTRSVADRGQILVPVVPAWRRAVSGGLTVFKWAAVMVGFMGYGAYGMAQYESAPRDRVIVQKNSFDPTPTPLLRAVNVTTEAGEWKVVEMRGGSRVELAPLSDLKYEYRLKHNEVYGTFGGEALFEVSEGEGRMVLATPAGHLDLSRGRYGVKCGPDCLSLLVTVAAGMATIRADTGSAKVSLTAGLRGRMLRGGMVELVTGADTVGFPVPPKFRP